MIENFGTGKGPRLTKTPRPRAGLSIVSSCLMRVIPHKSTAAKSYREFFRFSIVFPSNFFAQYHYGILYSTISGFLQRWKLILFIIILSDIMIQLSNVVLSYALEALSSIVVGVMTLDYFYFSVSLLN